MKNTNSHDKRDEEEKYILLLYKKTLKELIKEVIYFKGKYTKEQYYLSVDLDNLEGVAYGVRTNLDALKYNIEKILNTLLEEELDYIEDYLSELYLDIFDDKDSCDAALVFPWCGSNFKDTLIENHKHFIFNLNREIVAGLTREDSNKRLIESTTKVMNNLNNRTVKVIRTEATYINTKALIDRGLAEGYTRYLYVARMDEKTCGRCRTLHGTTGYLEKAKIGVDLPPIHSFCGCDIEIIK